MTERRIGLPHSSVVLSKPQARRRTRFSKRYGFFAALRMTDKKSQNLSVCHTPTHTAAAAPSPSLLLHSHSVSVSISFSFLLTCLRFGSAEKTSAFPRVFSLLPESFLIRRHFVIQQPQSWDEITPEPPPAYSKSRPAQPQTCLGTIIVFFPIRNGFFDSLRSLRMTG